jgi:hypothetical protein
LWTHDIGAEALAIAEKDLSHFIFEIVEGSNRTGFQCKTGPDLDLLGFTAHKHLDVIIINRDVENNRLTTNLAIFNVILMRHRGIEQHFDALTAIGA